MSFELFLLCSRNGKSTSFKRKLFEEIMAPDVAKPEHFPDNVEYPDESGGEVNGTEDDRIESLAFNHFGGDIFMQRIWELADRTKSFFVWPAEGRQIAVTKPENVRHVLPEILENLGPPFVVRSGKELDYVIANGVDYPGGAEAEAFEKLKEEAKAVASRISQIIKSSELKNGEEWRVNQYGIIANWKVRPEEPESLARRIVQTFGGLSKIDPLLRRWMITDHYPLPMEIGYQNQFTVPFEVACNKMPEIVRACAWRAGKEDLSDSLGYKLGAAVSDISSSRFMEFFATAGGRRESGPGFRKALLWTNRFMDPDPELITCPIFRAALLTLAKAWEPTFAVVTASSLDLRKEPHPFSPVWMTYLSSPFAQQVVPPSDVHVEHFEDGGVLMIATEEKFDVENPAHMAAAERICAAAASIDMENEPVFNDPLRNQ